MTDRDNIRIILSSYNGIRAMDEYLSKEYVLKDIEDYLNDFLEINEVADIDINEEKDYVTTNFTLLRNLQDCLLILPKINASIELLIMIKHKIKKIKEEGTDNL